MYANITINIRFILFPQFNIFSIHFSDLISCIYRGRYYVLWKLQNNSTIFTIIIYQKPNS